MNIVLLILKLSFYIITLRISSYNIIKLVVHVPVTDFSPLHIFKEGQLPEVLDSLNPSNLNQNQTSLLVAPQEPFLGVRNFIISKFPLE